MRWWGCPLPRETYEIPPSDDLKTLRKALEENFARLTQHLARLEGFDAYTPQMLNHLEMNSKRVRSVGIPQKRDDAQIKGLALSRDGFDSAWDAQGKPILNLPKGETEETRSATIGDVGQIVQTIVTQNVPSGVILLWSGSVASIPTGWVLCDGNNGTPDLTNQFVIGAGDTYNPDDTGGAATINLAHTHSADGTLATDADSTGPSATETVDNDLAGSTVAVASGTHNHSHSHDVTGDTDSALSAAQSILPPYYALAYIMKT